MVEDVKKRRFTKKDEESVADYVKQEFELRKGDSFRKTHEAIWSVIDKQIAMEAPKAQQKDKKKGDWHNSVQLGDIADALEVIGADTTRLLFPNDRSYFRPHIEIEGEIDPESGESKIDDNEQRIKDEVLRSLMVQQQADFGFRDRVKMSVKEALSHGGLVAVVEPSTMPKFHGGTDVEVLTSPTWTPYSMWNCYPDPSQHVIGTELFYRGSMIIKAEMPRSKVKKMPWRNIDKISEKQRGKTKDAPVEILYYYGDITIERTNGVMFLPNKKIVIADGHFAFQETNKTPFSPVIYTGYEKDDVRDPYFTSPLIKRSPMHSIATRSANKMLDAVDLSVEPPIAYDSLDPRFAKDGGPVIAPGAKIPTRGNASVKTIHVADPAPAREAMILAQRHVQDGTGVDATRKGVSASTEQTAFEVQKKDQKSEIRTIDFVGTLERQAVKPFLYMQHHLNTLELSNYPFYNSNKDTPDFLRASKSDLPKVVHFEITGSKEILGEEQRISRFATAVSFASQNERVAARTNWDSVSEEAWRLAGMKDPQRFVLTDDTNAEADQIKEQAEQAIQQMQEQMQKLMEEGKKTQLKLEKSEIEKATTKGELSIMEERQQAEVRIQSQQEALENKADEVAKDMATVEKLKTEVNALINTNQSLNNNVDANQQLIQQVNNLAQAISDSLSKMQEMDNERAARSQKVLEFVSSQEGFEGLLN